MASFYRTVFQRLSAIHPGLVSVAAADNDGVSMNGDTCYSAGSPPPNAITVGTVTNDGSVFRQSNTKSSNFEATPSAPGEQCEVAGLSRLSRKQLA